MSEVVKVVPKQNYCLEVELVGGRKGLIDVKPFLEHFLFEQLKEKTLFDQVEVDRFGGVKWPNGADICMDWIEGGNGVTDSGGMTCHAAIVSRELGIPAVVGTGDATSKLRDGEIVTVDATNGAVLEGERGPVAAVGTQAKAPSAPVPAPARVVTGTQILVNLSEPSQVQRAVALDVRRRGAFACRADGARGARWRSSPHAAPGGSRRGARLLDG